MGVWAMWGSGRLQQPRLPEVQARAAGGRESKGRSSPRPSWETAGGMALGSPHTEGLAVPAPQGPPTRRKRTACVGRGASALEGEQGWTQPEPRGLQRGAPRVAHAQVGRSAETLTMRGPRTRREAGREAHRVGRWAGGEKGPAWRRHRTPALRAAVNCSALCGSLSTCNCQCSRCRLHAALLSPFLSVRSECSEEQQRSCLSPGATAAGPRGPVRSQPVIQHPVTRTLS